MTAQRAPKVSTNAMSARATMTAQRAPKVRTNAMSARAKSPPPRERSELACAATTDPEGP
jgi:hypothetical protein